MKISGILPKRQFQPKNPTEFQENKKLNRKMQFQILVTPHMRKIKKQA
jgi:hypothetical protein